MCFVFARTLILTIFVQYCWINHLHVVRHYVLIIWYNWTQKTYKKEEYIYISDYSLRVKNGSRSEKKIPQVFESSWTDWYINYIDMPVLFRYENLINFIRNMKCVYLVLRRVDTITGMVGGFWVNFELGWFIGW